MPSKEYNLLPVHPIAQGPIWLCGCNLSSLRQKIIHFPLWVRTFWSPTIPTKMHPLKPFYVWVVFPLRTYFISFSLCSFRNDGFICILLICIYLYIAPWEMWISPFFRWGMPHPQLIISSSEAGIHLVLSSDPDFWSVICMCLFDCIHHLVSLFGELEWMMGFPGSAFWKPEISWCQT